MKTAASLAVLLAAVSLLLVGCESLALSSDDTHEKLRVVPGDVLYVEDDAGRVYRIDVAEKPSAHTIALDVTRVR